MGSKKIKFISIDDTGTPPVMPKDAVKFKNAARIFAKTLLDHPVSGRVCHLRHRRTGKYPQRSRWLADAQLHQRPVCRARQDFRRDHARTITARGGQPTHGCHPGCRSSVRKFTTTRTASTHLGFEYEPSGLGADCCIEDLDDIAEATTSWTTSA